MSKKLVLALALVGFAAACAPKQEEVIVPAQAPVTTEPVYQGKFGAN